MTKKITEGVRKRRIEILLSTRREERCVIVRELTAFGKKLTEEAIEAMVIPRQHIEQLKDKILAEERIIHDLRQEETEILDGAKLSHLSASGNKACQLGHVHPRLVEFDRETLREEYAILAE